MERFAIKIDKNLRANLYKICRLCGIDNPDKVKILDDEEAANLDDGDPELWKKVLDCVGLLITKDDKMPQFMCTLCVDKINDFYEFREMCYATDVQTRKLLGIKEVSKQKISTLITPAPEVKTEDKDIKQPVAEVCPQKPSRKRRNADMEICSALTEIKTDVTEDVKPPQKDTFPNGPKKKRLKVEVSAVETRIRSNPKLGPILGLPKKRLKTEPVTKERKDVKVLNVSKIPKRAVKTETNPEGRKPLPLQIQKRKMAFERLKQRKLAKKVAVVKVEKLRSSNIETKIKVEPAPTRTANSTPAPPQPKVKLKDKCAICKEGFANKILLDKHLKSIHIPSIVRYHCVQCDETLKKNMEIKNHNLWHKLSKTPFQCGNCSESSCSIYTYTKHIRDCGQVAYLDAHTPDWHCPECKGIFETTYLFNIHSCVSSTLVCPGCDKSLKWKEDYFKHIPTCPAAVHRIPSYMSPHIQVKNEAELPSSPIPQQVTATTAAQASRITPPLMDSNQCVIIPRNVSLRDEAASPSSKSTGKKSNRITKKDLKRFDELLKSTMTTLVSIKKEPNLGEEDNFESISSPSNAAAVSARASPQSLPAAMADDFHNRDSDNESTDDPVPTQHIKQEIIDEGYRDLYNNIEVNIKREVVLHENRNSPSASSKKKIDCPDEQVDLTPIKPVLKLKITKEHGTLNSILVDSPKSEKKKKKKKKKEDKHKSTDKASPSILERSESSTQDVGSTPDNPSMHATQPVEQEPAMPLPEIVHIKQEITESEEKENIEQLSSQSAHTTPSIVAATSGSLQISCVSEGVTFNTFDEITEPEEHTHTEADMNPDVVDHCASPDDDVDIKPRLEDLIPMLQIASVTSGAELTKPSEATAKKKRQSSHPIKTSFPTPKIVSISSGSEALALHHDVGEPTTVAEEPLEKVDSNKNVFDYSHLRIKEEIVDPTYDTPDLHVQEIPEESVVDADANVEQETIADELLEVDRELSFNAKVSDVDEPYVEGNADKELNVNEAPSTSQEIQQQSVDIDFIANIDFDNLNIKQEKEYIDDGLDDHVDYNDEHDDSNTESDSSSDSEVESSESDREYRDLPSENEDTTSNAISIPTQPSLGLQITTVHSEFHCPSEEEKTDSGMLVEEDSECKITSQPTAESGRPEFPAENQSLACSLVPADATEKPVVEKAHIIENDPEIIDPVQALLLTEMDNKPTTSSADSSDITKLESIVNDAGSSIEYEASKEDVDALQPIPVTEPIEDVALSDQTGIDNFIGVSDAALVEEDCEMSFIDDKPVTLMEPIITSLEPALTPLGPIAAALEPMATLEPSVPTLYTAEPNQLMTKNTIPTQDDATLEENIISDTVIAPSSPGKSQTTSQVNVNINLADSLENSKLDLDATVCLQAEANTSAISTLVGSASFSDLSQCSDGFGSNDMDPVVREIDRLIDTIDDDKLVSTHFAQQRSAEPNTEFEINSVAVEVGPPIVPTSITDLPTLTTEIGESIEMENKATSSTVLEDNPKQDLSPHDFAQSTIEFPSTSLSNNEFHQIATSSETTSYIPEYSESNYFGPSMNLNEICTSTPAIPRLDAFHTDLQVSTAAQLHSLVTPLPHNLPINTTPHSPSNDPDLTVPILSEEVQNLLNEGTVAVNNFELNDRLLHPSCSSSSGIYSPPAPSAVLVPNFRDLENVNEIAENNNNANIERELQDELGNVLAAAIANRSPDDEADDDNVMNENRANFDLT